MSSQDPATNHPPTPNGTSDDQWSVQKVLSDLPRYTIPTAPSPISFLHLLERLKTTARAGWVRHGVPNPESISDHMYRMAVMTMLAPRSLTSRLDTAKCTRMALVHDMAESLVGDITPVDPVSKEEKHRREARTMDYLCDELLHGTSEAQTSGLYADAAGEIKALFHEYEAGETEEAKFVKDIDKMELLLQRIEYERTSIEQGNPVELGEFSWVAASIRSAEVRSWANAVFRERKTMWAKAGKKVS